MSCYNNSYNRWLSLQYRDSTRYENVNKFVFDHKNHYHLITFFMLNFWWVSQGTIPQHKSVWILNETLDFNGGDFCHNRGFFDVVGAASPRAVEKLLGRRPPEFLLWTQQRNWTSIKIVLLLFLCSYQRAAPTSSGVASGSTQV